MRKKNFLEKHHYHRVENLFFFLKQKKMTTMNNKWSHTEYVKINEQKKNTPKAKKKLSLSFHFEILLLLLLKKIKQMDSV